MTTPSMSSPHWRRLQQLADAGSQSEVMEYQDYNRLVRQGSANELLRNLELASEATRGHPERDWREQVVEAAKLAGWVCYWTWNSVHSPAGMPDLILCKPPMLVFAELKTETGKVTDSQKCWLELLSQATDVRSTIWRPSDWPDVLEVLQSAT